MQIDRYISKRRIIDIKSLTFEGAIKELLQVCSIPAKAAFDKGKILTNLVAQEQAMSTYLGHGVSLPHARIPLDVPYIFAIGRCPHGLKCEGHSEEKQSIKLVFLFLASEVEHSYLNVLALLARILQAHNFWQDSLDIPIKDFQTQVMAAFGRVSSKIDAKTDRFNRLLLQKVSQIAQEAQCDSIFVFSDVFPDPIVELGKEFSKFKIVSVSQKATEVTQKGKMFSIPVRLFSKSRFSQLKTAIIIALTHGLIEHDERLCCISGLPNSCHFDAFMIVDVAQEIQAVFSNYREILPEGVKAEVFERLLAIATELAIEGREGSPVGCLFVLGSAEELKPYIRPLVLNPFFGYKREDRNVLNPFMTETIKEFASIDGAFVIDKDGVLESAGSMIHVPGNIDASIQFSGGIEANIQLPGGLGTRHATAAAISFIANCIVIVVSSSGVVTLFRRGKMLPLYSKNIDN